jgi:hypothetical protein
MKKLIASVIVTGLFTFGCDRCPDVARFFDIQDVLIQNSFTDLTLNGNQPNNFPDSVQFEHFVILASYRVNYYSVSNPAAFSLVPKAYALSCVEPGEGGTKEKITQLDLIALSDYDAGFKSGASLNAIAKINGLPVAQFIENQNKNPVNQFGFDITLTQKPDSTVKQAFKLVYKLTNGEQYSPETQPILIF